MSLFKKQNDTVTFSASDQTTAVSVYKSLKALKLKDTSISELMGNGEVFQFAIKTGDATKTFCETLTSISDLADTDSLEAILQYEDKKGKSRHYSQELLASIRLESGLPFGSENELVFIDSLRDSIAQTGIAVIGYVILSGGAATISIPSSEPEKIKILLEEKLNGENISAYQLNIVNREQA